MGAELRVQEFTAGGQSVSVLWLPADTLWPDSVKSRFMLYSADLTHNYCILSAWALAPSPLQEPSCWSRQQWYVSETYTATLCMTNSIGQFPLSKQWYTMNKHTIYPLPPPPTHTFLDTLTQTDTTTCGRALQIYTILQQLPKTWAVLRI